jgi:hypothetical protein
VPGCGPLSTRFPNAIRYSPIVRDRPLKKAVASEYVLSIQATRLSLQFAIMLRSKTRANDVLSIQIITQLNHFRLGFSDNAAWSKGQIRQSWCFVL